MITISPLPTWRQLFECKSIRYVYPDNMGNNCFYLQTSSISIEVIVRALMHVRKSPLTLWIPDYFCDDTLQPLRKIAGVKFYFYPINSSFDVEWSLLKEAAKDEKPDAFIFVHFFGIERDTSRAKNFCDSNQCALIEDCAHVMYPSGKIGKSGHFVLYSPHKSLPLPDGAMLAINRQKDEEELESEVKRLIDSLPEKKKDIVWIIKRVIQKLTGIRKKIHYSAKIHYASLNGKECNGKKMLRMSEWSMAVFYKYHSSKLQIYGYIRRFNLLIMNWLMENECPDIRSLSDPKKVECPYLAVYSMENVPDKQSLLDRLDKKGYLLQWWPDLPLELREKKAAHTTSEFLSENIFTVPIHQGMKPQSLIRRYRKTESVVRKKQNVEIIWTIDSCEKWENIYSEIPHSALSQSYIHGEIKKTEGWKPIRGMIYVDGEEAGTIQVLSKQVAAIIKVYRVSCGPMLLEKYQDGQHIAIRVLELVRKKFARLWSPLFCLPNLLLSPDALAYMTEIGYYHWKIRGFHSAWIDLSVTEEELRANIKSKWRNQLKKAEKSSLTVGDQKPDLEYLLEQFERFEQLNGFRGASTNLLRALFQTKNSYLVLQAYLDNELVSFVIIYLHGRAATYYVGWSNEKGRTHYANNLLLYQVMIRLKKKGYLYFDLGGYDEILTPDITHFKRGLNGREYRMLGEFIAL